MTKTHSSHWLDLICLIESGLNPNATPEETKADKQFPLSLLEERFRNHLSYGRIMAALVDLKLTMNFFASDFSFAGGVYNEQLHVNIISSRSQSQIFASKILFLRYLNSFVLRCRSFWDKAMGILVLVFCADRYESFVGGTSRRASFRELMSPYLDRQTILSIDSLIGLLDDKFRTAEAHQAGTLRTWVFKDWDPNPMNTPLGYLLGIHNMTLQYGESISKLLMDYNTQAESLTKEAV